MSNFTYDFGTFVYDDGGRAAAGFKGEVRDCATRAIAIATGRPYREVYDALNKLSLRERPTRHTRGKRSSAKDGVFSKTMHRYFQEIGWTWVPTMGIGTGTTTHLRADELPMGRLVARCSRHYVAVVDGEVHDTFDPSRDGTRAVYGYWIQPNVERTAE